MGSGRGGGVGGVGRGRGLLGSKVGVVCDVGHGDVNQRIEGIVKCT